MSGGIQHPPSYFSGLYETLKSTGALPSWLTSNAELGPVWFDAMVFSLITATVLIVLVIIGVRRMKKVPSKYQGIIEVSVEMLKGMLRSIIGPHGPQYLPFLGTLFIYILFLNLCGLLPGMKSPTMTLSTTLALGVATFFYVQYSAIKANGFIGYIKHFMGEIWWLAPLLFCIEVVGEFIKPCTLSLRLYGNIYGEDNIIALLLNKSPMLFGVIPIPMQFPMAAFAIFTSFLQAFIFVALACIYIAVLTEHSAHLEH